MIDRCHTPESVEAIELLPWNQQGKQILLNAPPMLGAEYLSAQVLEETWNLLDQWLCQTIRRSQISLSEFLKKQAPQWRQVGRVCFHLAENKRDPDYPFAFLATYASEVSRQGQIQYRPLA